MSRPNPLLLFAVLAAVLAAISALSLTKGGLYIARHEGDVLHLLAIVLRMEQGQIPHVDFMTPIGAFAFLPIHGFMKQGFGVDQAVHWGQTSVALALLPLIWWAAWTRLTGIWAYVFGLACVFLCLALVHGQAVDAVSISMHYNRWAWALAYIAVVLAVLPARGRAFPVIDGAIVGVCVAALVMIKVTYVVGLAPALIAGLLIRHSPRALIAALVAGLIVAAGVTLWGGFGFWLAYLGDLLTVTGSEVRPNPSLDLIGTLVTPAYFGGTVAALAAVILLRQGGAEQGGLLAFLLLPGFAFITYQNFANDPQWLVLLALIVLMLLPETDEDAPQRRSLPFVAAVLLAFAAPIFINLGYSPVRHALVSTETYAPILPNSPAHTGLQTASVRANRIDGVIPLDGPGSNLEAYRDLVERAEPTVFQGETLPQCEVVLGLPGWMDGVAQDIEAAGFAGGGRIFVADIFASHWMFNSQAPLVNGAPWYYGGLPGIDSSDHLLVPLCPALPPVREILIELLEDSGKTFTEVYRSPLYIMYSIS